MANYYLGDNDENSKKKKNKKGKNYTLQSNGTLKAEETEDIAPVKKTDTTELTKLKADYEKYKKLNKDAKENDDRNIVEKAFDFIGGRDWDYGDALEESKSAYEAKLNSLNNSSSKKKVSAEEDDGLDFFQSGLSGEGVSGTAETILGTGLDGLLEIGKGVGGLVEGVADLLGYGTSKVLDWVGADDLSAELKSEAQKNYVESLTKDADDWLDQRSFLGSTSEAILQGVGQVGAIVGTAGLGSAAGLTSAGTSVLTTGTMFASSSGSGIGEAYEGGATDGEAWAYGIGKGAIDAGTELLFGGLGKGVKALGVSKGISSLDDVFAKKLSSKISNQFFSNLAEWGVKSSAEGVEEWLAGLGSAAMKKLTYMSEEELSQLIEDENLLEQFVVGTVSSGIAQSGYVPGMKKGSLAEANKTGRDFITGLNQNEQAVIDKAYDNAIKEEEKGGKKLSNKEKNKIYDNIVEKMDKGDIDIDTIEEVLGGDTFKEYKSITEKEKALTDEISQLENLPKEQITVKQSERLTEAREELKNIPNKTELKTRLSDEVYGIAKNSRLVESYNEKARRSEAFTADLSQYKGKQREAVKRAIDSGVLNNTNKSHALVDTLSKIEADKGIVFDYADNAKLKESGFAVEGKTVNGFANKSKGAVTLNVQSAKAWQSVVGHEISHILEGTEHYDTLRQTLFKYAESKGELASRRAALTELYKDVDADIDAELTADLVGDYLFSDSKFIKDLTTNKNLFQKIYDEIKYLCKVATGKQLTEIEQVKKEFDNVWKELSEKGIDTIVENNKIANDGETQYSVSPETVSEHMSAVQSGNMLKAQALVERAAYESGLRYTGLHGTTSFGYTEFNRKKNRGKGAFFFTDKYRIAESYSGVKSKTDISSNTKQGNYYVALDIKNPLIVDCKNALWYDIPFAAIENGSGKNGNATTDDIAAYAEKNKYDGVIFKNIIDAGQISKFDEIEIKNTDEGKKKWSSTVYAVFESNQIKSLDAATYDNKGNLIPLSERFNPKKKDIRYSVSEERLENIGKILYNSNSPLAIDNRAKSNNNSSIKWVYKAEVFSVIENKLFHEKISEINQGSQAFQKNSIDEYMLPIENKIVFTDGNYETPYVSEIIEILTDSQTEFEAIKERIFDVEKGKSSKQDAVRYVQNVYGKGCVITYTSGNDGVYGWEDGRRKGKTRRTVIRNYLNKHYGRGNDNQINETKADLNGSAFSNADTQFSLSESVEETKDLVAVHNLQSSELVKTLELGGLPMPSIAVIKAQQSHEDYGDVSLIFSKNTIDPKKNKANKVYGGDAWTPTYPRIEYKVNEKSQKAIRNKINSLVPYDVQRGLGFLALDYDNMTNDLNRHNGDIGRVYENNYAMQYAFLVDNGFDEQLPTAEKHLDSSGRFGNPLIVDVAEKLGDAEIERLFDEFSYKDDAEIAKLRDMANESIKAKYSGDSKLLQALKKKPIYDETNFGYAQADNIIRAAYKYVQNGFEQTVDYKRATDVIADAVDKKAYEKWLNDLFADVVEKEGISNGKDIFTPSGNRRSWEALHWENTLENVVKVMKSQDQTGADAFAPTSALLAVANKKYGSIDEIKADSNRLGKVSEEDYESLKESYGNRLSEIANSIKNQNTSNEFVAMDEAAELIVDAVRNYKTKPAMFRYMKQWNNRVTESTVDDIFTLVSDIANMPTGYFEAKPQRAVGLDEVGVFVIPNNADIKLKQELLNRGYSIAEYDPNVEGDRKRVVNEFDNLKFSLSNVGEQPSPTGTPLQDLYLAPTQEVATDTPETIAPIREDISENATPTFEDDIAPMPTDADAPPEIEYYNTPDTTAIDEKALNNIGKSLRETLRLNADETKAIQEIVQEYSTSETPDKAELFEKIKEQFSEKIVKTKLNEVADIKRFLKSEPLFISDEVKADITDWKQFVKGLRGKVRLSKNGLSVDTYYDQLVTEFPDKFSYEYDEDFGDMTISGNQIRKIESVANTSVFQAESYTLDDDVIQKAVDIISNEVRGYKENLTRTAAENTATEALDAIAPTKATQLTDGSRGDALLNQSLDNHPVKTVEDKITEKIRAVEAELADNKQLRREAEAEYNREIERLSNEYLSKKNRNTKVANNIIRRIARLEDLKASVDDDYSKRISDLEARLEKMNTPEYNRAMHKQAKMQEHAEWAENLLGDTSTWKDKKLGLQYEVNTERRNLRDIVRDENGNKDIAKADAIDDALNGQYNREEAALKRELAQTRGKYANLKITKAEDTYIQMLGELRGNPDTELTEKVVNEYYEKHRDKIDKGKVEKVIELARQDYDNLLNRVNEKLREQGMKEIPYRKGYFPHFTEPKQNFIQKLLNWKTQDTEIPTSIAGLTEDFKPVKSWQSFDKTRHSDTTDYSFLKGFDNYSQGALDWIYHLDTLQKRRAVENYIRYTHSEEGISAEIKKIYANEEFDADKAQAEIEQVLAKANNPLNNFVQDFMTKTNILAGKKNTMDRGMEKHTNRKIYSTMTNVQNRVSANMVLANVRSALTNFIPITQSWAQVSPLRSLQATKDTIANAIKDDGMIEKSTFLTNRLREVDNLYNTTWDKVLDKAGIMFEVIDNFSSQVIWRSKYNQNLANGMSEAQAIKNADQFAENVMAGRSKGNEPTLFNAKSPFVKAFTMFQLEVNNQYGYFFKDVPNDLKAETNHWKLNLAKGYTTAFIGAYVYNALFEQLAGSGAALDPIGIIEDLLKDLGLFDDDDDELTKEELTNAGLNFADNVIKEIPLVGSIAGGGRIPISSAIPYADNGFFGGIKNFVKDVSEGNASGIDKEIQKPFYNLLLPVGGGQLKKTVQGLSMFNTDEDHPVAGSYTDSGSLRFPVEDTLANRVQAGIFGQYANENAREYFDNGYAPLKEKQIQEYVDVDLPIADYWKYREGLSKLEPLEGKTTVSLNQKGDYIGGLDLPVDKKNILINNIADRDTPIDYTGYENYSDFEEFDFATRYPEKYAVLQEQGISVADYKKNYEETAFMYTDDFAWASNNPEQYTVSKAVTSDVIQYKQYTTDLYNIKADKDSSGKSITGSRKEKVIDYVNNLDIDYGAKLVLFKAEYPSDDTYNAEIVNYLNNRADLTYDELVTIYTELGFTVKDGRVYWD